MLIHILYSLAVLFLTLINGHFGDIGSECTIDSNCVTTNTLCLIEFEECTIGRCQCGRDFYLKDGQCLSISRLGESCTSIDDCQAITPNAMCTSSVCQCPPNMPHTYDYLIDGKTYCYEALTGEACDDDEQCLSHAIDDNLGVCSVESPESGSVCGCSDQYQVLEHACHPVPYGGDCRIDDTQNKVCTHSTVCQGNVEVRMCLCDENMEYNRDLGQCVHVDAALNGSEEQLCNNRYDLAQGMLCLPDLQCDLCPEDEHLRAMFCLTPNHRNTAAMTSATLFSYLPVLILPIALRNLYIAL